MASEWPHMDRRGPAISEENVAQFEARFGHRLPDDYRRFLLEVNGGRLAAKNIRFSIGVVNTLFSLTDSTEARNLQVRAERAREGLPSRDLLEVGHDSGGARILIALDGGHRGEVWLHIATDGRPPDSNPRVLWHDRRDMTKLANGWAEFMASLQPYS